MSWDWDAITFFPDDVIPLAVGWDESIRLLSEQQKIEACCWKDVLDPGQPSYFILTRKYLLGLGGYTSTAWFPFWFDDTWVSEVHRLAFGNSLPIVEDMCIGGLNNRTTSMWDMDFWARFWVETRVLRMEQAKKLREAYGQPEPMLEFVLKSMEQHDKTWWEPIQDCATRVEFIERNRGEKGERTERYLAAKAKAEAWLKANKPSLFKRLRRLANV
jgi:hypothetical protein